MDIYGIGNTIRSMLGFYSIQSRSTGRTTHLLKMVQPGDRVIFSEDAHLRHFKGLMRDHGMNGVELVVRPVNRNPLECLGTGQGQTYFDHNWVEDRYKWVIDSEAKALDGMQRALSGHGIEHKRTAQAARDLNMFLDMGLLRK